jgi:hypothetical protein
MKNLIKKQIKKIFYRTKFRYLTTKYFFDKPMTLYHPLPWMGINHAKRAKGTKIRFDLINRILDDNKGSVFDFGCAEGFFSISLAEKGYNVLSLEAKKDRYEIVKLVSKILGLNNISFLNMKVDENTIKHFPVFNYTLCLAVWHHWVRYFGFENAENILITLWSKTTKYMFFETGLSELPKEYGMPKIEGDYDKWLVNYLESILPNSEISVIGQAPAFPPEQFASMKTKHDDESFLRNIYCIKKINI